MKQTLQDQCMVLDLTVAHMPTGRGLQPLPYMYAISSLATWTDGAPRAVDFNEALTVQDGIVVFDTTINEWRRAIGNDTVPVSPELVAYAKRRAAFAVVRAGHSRRSDTFSVTSFYRALDVYHEVAFR